MKIVVPGNILLAGEYSILYPGCIGIGMAVKPMVSAHLKRSKRFQITGYFGNSEVTYRPHTCKKHKTKLFECVYTQVNHTLKRLNIRPSFNCSVDIDSSDFYTAKGQKKGFGSSAAVAVALSYTLLSYILGPRKDIDKLVYQSALKGHRAFQSGHASGYDIAASLYGGIGIFTGGHLPQWKRIRPFWKDVLYYMRNAEPVSTKGAVKRFIKWKKHEQKSAEEFLELSNYYIDTLARADTFEKLGKTFILYADLVKNLGQKIKCQADISVFASAIESMYQRKYLSKCSGAGDELAIAIAKSNPSNNEKKMYNLKKLKISWRGARLA